MWKTASRRNSAWLTKSAADNDEDAFATRKAKGVDLELREWWGPGLRAIATCKRMVRQAENKLRGESYTA